MNTRNTFFVDFVNRTINGTKAAFNKAGKGFGSEYEELCRLMEKHPDFSINTIIPKKHINRSKHTYEGMTKHFIEDYVEMKGNASHITQMNNIKDFYEENKEQPLPKLKSWFLKTYSSNNNGSYDFNMADAVEEVRVWKLNRAAEDSTPKEKEDSPADFANNNVSGSKAA